MFCFDTDVMSAAVRRDPPLELIRRLSRVSADDQYTTAVTFGELLYGAVKKGSPALLSRVRDIVSRAAAILPFDEQAAEVYATLRARLETEGRSLAEPDLRIAAIVLTRDLTLVTGNVRHFSRVPELRVENWLTSP
jgi:tRNA(fMet)-specific endonuclease VapC